MTRTLSKLSRSDLHKALQSERLVGVTKASELLGIKPSNFKRDAAPHLLEVEVEGSASSYFRSEVEELAAERSRRRAAAASNGTPKAA